jgi:hypothetical protein
MVPGQHCARCRNANAPCNCSETDRRGRPVTQVGYVVNQNSTAAVNPTGAAIPPSNRATADEGTWIQSTLTEYGAGEGFEYLIEGPDGSLYTAWLSELVERTVISTVNPESCQIQWFEHGSPPSSVSVRVWNHITDKRIPYIFAGCRAVIPLS